MRRQRINRTTILIQDLSQLEAYCMLERLKEKEAQQLLSPFELSLKEELEFRLAELMQQEA